MTAPVPVGEILQTLSGQPLVFEEDLESGAPRWSMTDPKSGLNEVLFDDMDHPIMKTADKTILTRTLGLGSFAKPVVPAMTPGPSTTPASGPRPNSHAAAVAFRAALA